MSDQLNLNHKQEKVLDYIRIYSKKSDLTKNMIVNAFKESDSKRGKYARMTILSIIDYLDKNNLIKIDEINTKYHVVRSNNEHLLVKLENELDEFEEKYLILTEKLKYISTSKITLEEERKDKNNLQIGESILLLFQHLVNMYIIYSLEIWPKQTKDKDEKLLGTLYVTLFKRLRKMYTDLLHLQISPSFEVPILHNLVLNSFLLTKNNIGIILKRSKQKDIQPEIEKVIDTLWKISKYFFPFVSPEFEKAPQPKEGFKPDKRIPNDWRDVIDYNE
jgi:hypothetical protein